jgi:predicted nuclease of restriction endonuclease-like (RecB) superfamily
MEFPHEPKAMTSKRQNRSDSKRLTAALPPDYSALLVDVKNRIRTAQIRASLSVNRELIQLYWDIGHLIVERQRAQGWGRSVVERLAADIQKGFPGMAGFSPQNIWKMRGFFLAWTAEVRNLSQAAGESGRDKFLSQLVREIDGEHLPRVAAEIPWGHNIVLIFKLKDPVQRLWYGHQVTANGWSRSILEHWIESDVYSRQGKAVTNFSNALPPPQSDLAKEVVRDPYNFDFLTLREPIAERELEEGLLAHIRKFLLELGAGFAFVGQQVHLVVDGEDFYIDLLFYHLKLRCYVIVDLKTTAFKPEYTGKMNFYLSAVDDLLRHPDDKLSLGLILCKTRSKIVAEYALRNVRSPMSIAHYTTKLVASLPAEFKDSLPSPEEIEAELKIGQGDRTASTRESGRNRSLT